MLPRKHRLTTDKDVTRVLRKGRAVFTNLVIVKALPNDLGVTRATVVVGTKVEKRSTKRNLIKRRLRAVLESKISNFKIALDLVVLAQPEAVGRKQADLAAALEYCFKKLKIV